MSSSPKGSSQLPSSSGRGSSHFEEQMDSYSTDQRYLGGIDDIFTKEPTSYAFEKESPPTIPSYGRSSHPLGGSNMSSNDFVGRLWDDNVRIVLHPLESTDFVPPLPTNISIPQIMHAQQTTFSKQLNELQKAISVQKTLTGADPLTQQSTSQRSPTTEKKSSVVSRATTSAVDSRKDPKAQNKLEDKLSSMLDQNGGLLSVDQIPKFVKFMLKEETIDGQSLLLTIVLSTKDPLRLNKFVDSDGLQILKMWLENSKNDNRTTHLRLILKVLQHVPMTLKALRATELGKVVNKLVKYSDHQVAEKASALVDSWMKLLPTAEQKAEQAKKVKPEPSQPANKKRKEADSPTMEHAKPVQKKEKPAEDKSQQKKLIANDDFDAQLSSKPETKKPKLAPDHIKTKRSKTQLIEDTNLASSVKAAAKNNYEAKPISNDAIKKAKFKEKVLGKETAAPSSPVQASKMPTPTLLAKEKAPQLTAMETETVQEDDVWLEPAEPEPEFIPESPVGISKKTGGPKKRVSWPTDDRLEMVKVFAKEEEVVHDEHNFQLAKQNELKKEREILINKKKMEEVELKERQLSMQPTIPWRKPPVLTLDPNVVVDRGSNSKQKEIQANRELSELAALYFDEDQIPENPIEAQPEEDYDDSKTKTIPFEEAAPPAPVTAPPPSTFGLPVLANFPPNVGANPNVNAPPSLPFLSPELLNVLMANPQLLNTVMNQPGALQGLPLPQAQQFTPVSQPQGTSPRFGTQSNFPQSQQQRGSYTPNQQSDGRSQGSRQQPHPDAIKKKPCIYFNTPQGCRFGEKCTFIHDPNLPQQPNPPTPQNFRGNANRQPNNQQSAPVQPNPHNVQQHGVTQQYTPQQYNPQQYNPQQQQPYNAQQTPQHAPQHTQQQYNPQYNPQQHNQPQYQPQYATHGQQPNQRPPSSYPPPQNQPHSHAQPLPHQMQMPQTYNNRNR